MPILDQLRNRNNEGRVKRQLTRDEQRKVNKLTEILADLKAVKHVQNRKISTWLGDDWKQQLADRWENEQVSRNPLGEKPDVVKNYEKKLRKADFSYNKADIYSQRGKSQTAKKMFSNAERQYEQALEALQEAVSTNAGMSQWFDRDTTCTPESTIGISPQQMPRTVTSKSTNRQGTGIAGKKSKRDIKIEAVERALDELLFEARDTGKSSKAEMLLRDGLNDDLFDL